MSIYYVYIHRTGDTNEVFYVGKGSDKRFLQKTNRNIHWHRKVNKHGFVAEIVIDDLDEISSFSWEHYLITFYRSIGWNLVNMTNGGEGISGLQRSLEHNLKISNAMKGKGSGRVLSEETKARMSQARTGKRHSAETRIKMSESQIVRWTSHRSQKQQPIVCKHQNEQCRGV